MSLDEETLERVARDAQMDYTKWPSMLEPLLERVNHIVYNDFPIPKPYPNLRDVAPPTQNMADATEGTLPQTDQANPPQTPSKPPVPLFGSSATSASRVADSMPASQNEGSPSQQSEELPQPLLLLLNGIIATLRATFTERPPHTIQRLSELVLNPTKHYRTLPAWLRAVDRVVNVSSTADIFPLPDQAPFINGVNGDTTGILVGASGGSSIRNGYDSNSLGSDESLGGALLTPIPWLRNGTQSTEDSGTGDTQENTASTEESNHDGSSQDSATAGETTGAANTIVVGASHDPLVPERPEGAVTQGELIRQEQEAGVVPVSANPTRPMPHHDDSELGEDEEDAESIPHARGPDLLGAVDMGKVEGKTMEVSIGSPPQPPQSVADLELDTAAGPTMVPGSEEEKARLAMSAKADKTEIGEEDYEMVDRADEMDVDDDKMGSSKVTKESSMGQAVENEVGKKPAESDADEDMVLVDAAEDDGGGTAAASAKDKP